MTFVEIVLRSVLSRLTRPKVPFLLFSIHFVLLFAWSLPPAIGGKTDSDEETPLTTQNVRGVN